MFHCKCNCLSLSLRNTNKYRQQRFQLDGGRISLWGMLSEGNKEGSRCSYGMVVVEVCVRVCLSKRGSEKDEVQKGAEIQRKGIDGGEGERKRRGKGNARSLKFGILIRWGLISLHMHIHTCFAYLARTLTDVIHFKGTDLELNPMFLISGKWLSQPPWGQGDVFKCLFCVWITMPYFKND